ncbi:MAG: M16 family metallopeptidase [Vicinamibacterales bacterium]
MIGTSRGLSPARVVLPNGITVIAKQTRRAPSVAISFAVRGGSSAEPPSAAGAMHLLSRVIDRGTKGRSAAEIADALDSRGLSLSCGASRHHLSLVCTCLADDFEAVFRLMSEIVREPAIPASELVTRKREAVTSLRQDEDNPAVRAVDALLTLLYGAGHPYGRPVKGEIDSVDGLTREDLLRLHAVRIAPSELCIVVVGDVDPSQVDAYAASCLADWFVHPPPPVLFGPIPHLPGRQLLVIPMMNKAQADIAYGFTSMRRDDPGYHAAWLMNNILGEYAMGGRLGDSIRERQGMAYYVSSSLDAAPIEAPLIIRAGVSAANVDRTLASMDVELAALRERGVTDRELAESKQYLIGSMPRALETNLGIAQFLQGVEFFGLGLDYDLRLPDLLSGVTRADVLEAAAALDPSRAAVVVAGPYPPA